MKVARAYVDHYKGIRKQSRRTPRSLFDALHARFNFTMDGAASKSNALLPQFSSRIRRLSWEGQRVFCNPPWDDIATFIALGPKAEFALFLVPARTNVRWFHDALKYGAVPEFFYGRVKFDGLPHNSPVDCLLLKFGSEVTE